MTNQQLANTILDRIDTEIDKQNARLAELDRLCREPGCTLDTICEETGKSYRDEFNRVQRKIRELKGSLLDDVHSTLNGLFEDAKL